MRFFKTVGLTTLFCLSLSAFAQVEPTPSEQNSDENISLSQMQMPEQVIIPCEVINPEDFKNTKDLSRYSLDKYESVQIIFQPNIATVITSMKLFAGKFSLAPRDPRLYRTIIRSKLEANSTLNLKNTNRADHDAVVLSPDLKQGKIMLDNGVVLQLLCSEE